MHPFFYFSNYGQVAGASTATVGSDKNIASANYVIFLLHYLLSFSGTGIYLSCVLSFRSSCKMEI